MTENAGTPGSAGQSSAAGVTGFAGAMGGAGVTGAMGGTGVTGAAGLAGVTGSAGVAGATIAGMTGSAAVGGNAGGAGLAGLGGGAGSGGSGTIDVGFEAAVQPFINKACNCHQSTPLMAPMSLKPGEAYKLLVSVPSLQLPTMLLVKPGSTADSYLWHKVNGTHLEVGGMGMIMPYTVPLNAEEKKIFQSWIAAGAPP